MVETEALEGVVAAAAGMEFLAEVVEVLAEESVQAADREALAAAAAMAGVDFMQPAVEAWEAVAVLTAPEEMAGRWEALFSSIRVQ